MDEKIGYLNLFVHRDKDLSSASLIQQQISGNYPSLVFVCNAANDSIEFENNAFADPAGIPALEKRTVDDSFARLFIRRISP